MLILSSRWPEGWRPSGILASSVVKWWLLFLFMSGNSLHILFYRNWAYNIFYGFRKGQKKKKKKKDKKRLAEDTSPPRLEWNRLSKIMKSVLFLNRRINYCSLVACLPRGLCSKLTSVHKVLSLHSDLPPSLPLSSRQLWSPFTSSSALLIFFFVWQYLIHSNMKSQDYNERHDRLLENWRSSDEWGILGNLLGRWGR